MKTVSQLSRLFGLALAVGLGSAPASTAAAEAVLHVANWTDYIDQKALEEFTKETGIKVVYDTYDSNEILETRLLAGGTGYDIVVPSATFLQRQIKAGVFQKINKALVPNLKGVSGEVAARLGVYDPGNEFSVPYMWFTTGIAYRPTPLVVFSLAYEYTLTNSGKSLGSIDVLGKRPRGIGFLPDGSRAYVTNEVSGTVRLDGEVRGERVSMEGRAIFEFLGA